MPYLPPPPSGLTGVIAEYLGQMCRVINQVPNVSYFSGTTPNSVLTGVAGDLAVNVASASTDTRVWVKGGSVTQPNTSGWVTLRTGPA